LEEKNLRLPSRAQVLFEEASTRPDFIYDEEYLVVYVDGPYHDFEERHQRDVAQTNAMKNLGYSVMRFHHSDSWSELVATRQDVFGDGAQ
jgi:very-short-patch-repair endonuclease